MFRTPQSCTNPTGASEEGPSGAGRSGLWRKPLWRLCGKFGRGQPCQVSRRPAAWRPHTRGICTSTVSVEPCVNSITHSGLSQSVFHYGFIGNVSFCADSVNQKYSFIVCCAFFLQYNGVSMKTKTKEEAYLEMLKPAETITFKVQNCVDELTAVKESPGDGFFIRYKLKCATLYQLMRTGK